MSIIARFVHDDRAGVQEKPGIIRKIIAWIIAELILFDEDDPTGFSHVEAVTPDGKYLGAHTTGVEARPMDYDIGFKRERFYLLQADDETSAKFYHYLNAVAEKHEGYDLQAIFGFITHFDMNKIHTTICSGLFVLALRWPLWLPIPLGVPAHRISVRDLELMLRARAAGDVREIEKTDPVFIAHIGGAKTP